MSLTQTANQFYCHAQQHLMSCPVNLLYCSICGCYL